MVSRSLVESLENSVSESIVRRIFSRFREVKGCVSQESGKKTKENDWAKFAESEAYALSFIGSLFLTETGSEARQFWTLQYAVVMGVTLQNEL